MAKKKDREISKRRSEAREKTTRKRALWSVKSKAKPKVIHRPGLPYMGAPEGFRSISIAQAMMEYAKPIMKYTEGDENGLDDAIQITTMLWNYTISVERGNEDKDLEKEILKTLRKTLNLDKHQAQALLTKMVERYRYLFPQDIQPELGLPFMFIRKELRHLIRPFDYRKLVLSKEIIPPDKKDRDMIEKIRRLDGYMSDGTEYGTYEDLFFSLKDACEDLFEKWLIAKGLKADARDFSFCLSTYLDFIYGYMHDEVVILKSVPDIYLIEFFEDFLLRKMMVEPNEYVYWPPALKLFYQFLHEKGYLDTHEKLIGKIDKIEPYFMEVLKKQFS
jgi:hypothetical protein